MEEDTRIEIRLALPSKGRLADDAMTLLANAGLRVHKPNPRQFKAAIPSLPGITVLFQRAGDLVLSVRDGSVDFGITGLDVATELHDDNHEVLILHRELGFGFCTLNVIVPEGWRKENVMLDLWMKAQEMERPLRVATKFPNLTMAFFKKHSLANIQLIQSEGTLEIAPTIGYADLIVDLVSTGTTLKDNRLKTLEDGLILSSQACLIANRTALKRRPQVLAVARQLLEFIVAHLRAAENVAIFANMRGNSPKEIAEKMRSKAVIGGLQGPTISPLLSRENGNWFAVHIVVRRDQLAQAINELRAIGGSGVVVAPVMYIFEEEPQAYRDMLNALQS